MMLFYLFSLANDNSSLDHIAKLADITGPMIPEKHFGCSLRYELSRFVMPLAEFLDHVLNQQRNVVSVLSQGRKLDCNYVKAVQQVLSQSLLLHCLHRVFVGSRNHSNVDADLFC